MKVWPHFRSGQSERDQLTWDTLQHTSLGEKELRL